MPVSMYQASVPAILKMLNNLTLLLDKAATWTAARKMEESALLNARLYPDMFPLVRQIQIVSDNAKGIAGRLANQEIPSFADTEATVAELKARLAKTTDFVKALHPSAFDGADTRMVSIPVGGGKKVELTGQDYLFGSGLANFYFHATAAYSILRQAGIEIGKRDYLG